MYLITASHNGGLYRFDKVNTIEEAVDELLSQACEDNLFAYVHFESDDNELEEIPSNTRTIWRNYLKRDLELTVDIDEQNVWCYKILTKQDNPAL
jgi:hypothetical protein